MKDTIRILHIFGRMERGGAEMRTIDLMRYIDRNRYQLHFCSLSGKEGDLDKEIKELGGQIHYLRLSPSFPFRFISFLKKYQFGVVHSHVHMFSGFILLLAVMAKVGTQPRLLAITRYLFRRC